MTLEADDRGEFLSARALGRALGVSEQTVRNYAAAGVLVGEKNADGILKFHVERSRAAVAMYKAPGAVGLKGGRRAGAGRKRKVQTDKVQSSNAEGEGTQERGRQGGSSATARDQDPTLGLEFGNTAAQAKALERADLLESAEGLMLALGKGGMPLEEAARQRAVTAAAAERLKLRQAQGRLLDTDEVAAAVGRAVAAAQAALLALPESLAARVGAELKLDAAGAAVVRDRISGEIDRVLGELADDPLGLKSERAEAA